MKNFKECKEVFIQYQLGNISQENFDNWSKANCEKCLLYIGKKGQKHCIFGNKH